MPGACEEEEIMSDALSVIIQQIEQLTELSRKMELQSALRNIEAVARAELQQVPEEGNWWNRLRVTVACWVAP